MKSAGLALDHLRELRAGIEFDLPFDGSAESTRIARACRWCSWSARANVLHHDPAPRTIAFVNARIAGFGPGVLRIRGPRIVSVGEPAQHGDHLIDLNGDRLLPGLINAHDHLQLNHYPRLKYRARHDNVSEWVRDIESRRASDPLLTAGAEPPRPDRLVLGGLKNLLSWRDHGRASRRAVR